MTAIKVGRPTVKYDRTEMAARMARREEDRKAARWIFALAWCGLSVGEIAHVLNITLTEVRQPLYAHNWLLYDRVRLPKVLSDDFRELWADTTTAPEGLRELLEKADARHHN